MDKLEIAKIAIEIAEINEQINELYISKKNKEKQLAAEYAAIKDFCRSGKTIKDLYGGSD